MRLPACARWNVTESDPPGCDLRPHRSEGEYRPLLAAVRRRRSLTRRSLLLLLLMDRTAGCPWHSSREAAGPRPRDGFGDRLVDPRERFHMLGVAHVLIGVGRELFHRSGTLTGE